MTDSGRDTINAIERAANGDADALSSLLQFCGPKVGKSLTISPTWKSSLDVADVLQVTYMEAFLRIRDLTARHEEGFVAWLKRIAENNLRDAVRALSRDKRPDPRNRVRATPADSSSYVTLLEAIGADGPTASRVVAGGEIVTVMQAAITKLPESYRKVIELYDLKGESAPQVAEALGKSPGAVYMLRARALDALREILGSASDYFSDLP